MNAEILSVGTELLLGDILNTNAQYISQQLAELGISVFFQTVVGDNPERLLSAYKSAFERADLIITTGGLGPTDDDLTKEIAAKYFSREMILDEESVKHLKNYFDKRFESIPQSNMKQAYIPEGSKTIYNCNGTAPGCMIEENGKILIMLPGPPNEAVPMFENEVKPFLKQKQDKTFLSKTIHLCGIGESKAAEIIKDLMLESKNPTVAPYAKNGEMLFRITAAGNNKNECEELIKPAVNEIYRNFEEFVYGEDDTTLAQAVLNMLMDKNLSVSTAESCTGGLLASAFVDLSGASAVFLNGAVTYSNESKIRVLGVKEETLDTSGAVSEETAKQMAEGIAKTSKTDIGLSTTGIAGPEGGTAEKPVGLVYIGISIKGNTIVKKLELKGTRTKIRQSTVTSVLNTLRKELKKY